MGVRHPRASRRGRSSASARRRRRARRTAPNAPSQSEQDPDLDRGTVPLRGLGRSLGLTRRLGLSAGASVSAGARLRCRLVVAAARRGDRREGEHERGQQQPQAPAPVRLDACRSIEPPFSPLDQYDRRSSLIRLPAHLTRRSIPPALAPAPASSRRPVRIASAGAPAAPAPGPGPAPSPGPAPTPRSRSGRPVRPGRSRGR